MSPRKLARLAAFASVLVLGLSVVNAQTVVYVEDNAALGGDGATWDTAYKYLQDALIGAADRTEIRVAQGTYRPDRDEAGNVTRGDAQATFQLVTSVAVRGGYAGVIARNPDAHDPSRYPSILNGDLNDNDVPVACTADYPDCFQFGRFCIDGFCVTGQENDENTHHVVTGSATDATAVLDGFTITAGNYGGIYNSGGSPTLINCTLSGNRAGSRGGGMYNHSGSPTLIDCTFSGNEARSEGGGMYNTLGSPTLTRCTFSDNCSSYAGGIYNDEGSPTLTNCTFTGNRAEGRGGGMYNWYGSAVLNNCAFTGNIAWSRAGGIYVFGDLTLSNCTFSGNTAWILGGGIFSSNGSLTLTGCILWGNADNFGEDESSQLFFGADATPSIDYSCVQGWLGGLGGTGNFGHNPQLVDADGADDLPGTADDNVRLSLGSPAINAGDPNFMPDSGETDLDGHARVLCQEIDMGAYEFGIGDCNCDQTVGLTDFSNWESCFTGPNGGPYHIGCEAFDFNYNHTVDLVDFAGFQRVLTSVRP